MTGRPAICHGCEWDNLNRRFTVQGTDSLAPIDIGDDSVTVFEYLRDGWTVTLHDHKGTR